MRNSFDYKRKHTVYTAAAGAAANYVLMMKVKPTFIRFDFLHEHFFHPRCMKKKKKKLNSKTNVKSMLNNFALIYLLSCLSAPLNISLIPFHTNTLVFVTGKYISTQIHKNNIRFAGKIWKTTTTMTQNERKNICAFFHSNEKFKLGVGKIIMKNHLNKIAQFFPFLGGGKIPLFGCCDVTVYISFCKRGCENLSSSG